MWNKRRPVARRGAKSPTESPTDVLCLSAPANPAVAIPHQAR